MKRLTISMSDELFDKLDAIENKSLFIRKLIERELDMLEREHDMLNNIPADDKMSWPEKFAILRDDVDVIFSRLEHVENKIKTEEGFSGKLHIEPDIGNIQEQMKKSVKTYDTILPETSMHTLENTGSDIIENTGENNSTTKTDVLLFEQELPQPMEASPEETEPALEQLDLLPDPIQKNTIGHELQTTEELHMPSMGTAHEMKLSEIVAEKIGQTEVPTSHNSENEIATEPASQPATERTIENQAEMTEYKMPELKPPVQDNQDAGFVMPELKPPVQESQDSAFVMPELKPPVQEGQDSAFVMPELKPPVQDNQDAGFVMPELKPPVQEGQDAGFVMPELKPPVQDNQDAGFVMPELKPPVQESQDSAFVMPELKPPVQDNMDAGFVMPELKPPVQEGQDAGFVMPELKPPVQEDQDAGFVMPELKPPVQDNQDAGFVMPELKPPALGEQPPGFVIHDPEQNIMPEFNQAGIDSTAELPSVKVPEMQQTGKLGDLPPFMDTEEGNMPQIQETSVKSAVHSPDVAPHRNENLKPDKLETNILMYMPRGAKVKKEIIKSLVSRQFSQEEIDMKIRDLVVREVLVLRQENGIEHLHRLK